MNAAVTQPVLTEDAIYAFLELDRLRDELAYSEQARECADAMITDTVRWQRALAHWDAEIPRLRARIDELEGATA